MNKIGVAQATNNTYTPSSVAARGDDIVFIDSGTIYRVTQDGSDFQEQATAAISASANYLQYSSDGEYVAYCPSDNVCGALNATNFEPVFTVSDFTGTPTGAALSFRNDWFYVSTTAGLFVWDVSDQTTFEGDPDNDGPDTTCIGEQCNPSGPVTTSTGTTTGSGVTGDGGDGGFIGDPGEGFPGINFDQVATDMGIGVQALAWLVGILLIIGLTVGMAQIKPANITAPVGAFAGFGLSVAWSLIPLWFAVVLAITAAGALVMFLRR